MIRRALPFLLVPLAMIAVGLAGAPWLRAYPSSVLAAPLLGAATLSVLVPVVAVGIGIRRLWITVTIDVLVFVFFTTLVGLHDPVGLTGIYDGIVHGPSQILTFALPLVSPRTLLVPPIALCWIAGTIVGECVGRGWHSVLSYATLLVTFGVSYAGSVRGIDSLGDGRRYDVLLAAGLLLTALVMRAVEAWIEQDLDADLALPDGRLPMRGLLIGLVVAVSVTGLAGAAVGSKAFSGPPVTPDRRPPIARTTPVSPVAFVADLRPSDPSAAGSPLFTVRVDRASSGYIGLADVDDYDGEGWTFDRTFRPSGGVIPAESDPTLQVRTPPVMQEYRIDAGALTESPWMPFLYRPKQVSTPVDVDSASGMIVPSVTLHAGERYSVTSDVAHGVFATLPSSALPATSTPPSYTFVPGDVASSLGAVISAFETETGAQDTNAVTFLQALSRDLQRNYTLSGARPQPSSSAASSSAPSSTSPSPSPSSGDAATAAGGTGFATVLASILGPDRAATPEQYATLVALVARQLGVPARLVSGFRVGQGSMQPGRTYQVSTAEAWTWVEIPVEGRGWVVLDPSPSRGSSAQQPSQSAVARPSPSPTPTVTPDGLATQSNQGHAVAPKSSVPGSLRVSVPLALIVVGAVLLGLALAVALLWGRGWVRARRRRRIDDPRLRLVGAWQEGLDMLVESGLPDPVALTSAEIAALTRDRFGHESAVQVHVLGNRANTAIFSPASRVEPGDADAAWQVQAVLRRTVRGQLTLRQRAGARLHYRRASGSERRGRRRMSRRD